MDNKACVTTGKAYVVSTDFSGEIHALAKQIVLLCPWLRVTRVMGEVKGSRPFQSKQRSKFSNLVGMGGK